MLKVTGLRSGYGRARVLFGIDLEVAEGTVTAVLGRNGVGKTTLLNTLMGVIPADSGQITFRGRDITRQPPHARVGLGLAYVPQGHQSFPHLTVAENLHVAADATGRRRGAGRGRGAGPSEAAGRDDSAGRRGDAIAEALEVFPALTELRDRRAGLLSGGQRQQLAIARALVTRPDLLILDEPTEGIQPSIVTEIEDAIERLHHDQGLTVLLVEQHLGLARRLADSIVVLDAGHVVRSGTPADLDDTTLHTLISV